MMVCAPIGKTATAIDRLATERMPREKRSCCGSRECREKLWRGGNILVALRGQVEAG